MDLTEEEREIGQELGFDEEALRYIKQTTNSPLVAWQGQDDQEIEGLFVLGDRAVRDQLQTYLQPRGYIAFCYEEWEKGQKQSYVGILKSNDPCDILRFAGTSGNDHPASTEEVAATLDAWKSICDFEIAAAQRDLADLVFSRLPEDLCRFAEQAYFLCPDTVHQGVGLIDMEEEGHLLQEAEALCPELSEEASVLLQEEQEKLAAYRPNLSAQMQKLMEIVERQPHPTTEQCIKLLALAISTTKHLYLWWD